jgi:hypothetical protein
MASLGEELLGIVNKLQDLVFNTIGNDSLDLPQIVRHLPSALRTQMAELRANSWFRSSLDHSRLENHQSWKILLVGISFLGAAA